ncbi:hypothetical protein JJJ17_04230 [Paracoccus caeni]|uniref:Uncharacterized protein n=1 Tax=Paracoccus caeni TaxID=657651 RepID=A0A934SC00_9RHOB|nr:hypothetical protein [Paracoccus caeni]MBK4215127.1 hypothetical protein [Paracoccus caeni]
MSEKMQPLQRKFEDTAQISYASGYLGGRPATGGETRFLRRFGGRVRLVSLILCWLSLSLMLSPFLLAAGFILYLLKMTFSWPPDGSFVAMAAIFVPAVLFLYFLLIKAWGRSLLAFVRVSHRLRLPTEPRIAFFDTRLEVMSHPTAGLQNIFAINGRPVDIPKHWEKEIIKRFGENRYGLRCRAGLLRLEGASDEVIRFSARRENVFERIDSVFPDLGTVVVALDDLSIASETEARLPLIRAQQPMLAFGIVSMILAGLFAWVLWAMQDISQDKVEAMRRDLMGQATAQLLDVEGLARRGFRDLQIEPGEVQLISGAAFEAVRVQVQGEDLPRLLLPGEAEALEKALDGDGSWTAQHADRMRQKLSDMARNLPDPTAQGLLRDIDMIPVEMLPSLLGGETPLTLAEPDLLRSLMPKPTVYAVWPGPMTRCRPDANCRLDAQPQLFEDWRIIAARDGYQVLTGWERERAETKIERIEAPRSRLPIIWGGIAVVAAFGLWLVLSFLLARRRIRRTRV